MDKVNITYTSSYTCLIDLSKQRSDDETTPGTTKLALTNIKSTIQDFNLFIQCVII